MQRCTQGGGVYVGEPPPDCMCRQDLAGWPYSHIAIYMCGSGQSLLLAVSIVAICFYSLNGVYALIIILQILYLYTSICGCSCTHRHIHKVHKHSLSNHLAQTWTHNLSLRQTQSTHRHTHTQTQHEEGSTLVHPTIHMYTLGHAMYVLFYDCTHRQSVT